MKVKFLSPVQHDARLHQPGETADLPRATAESLIDAGAAEPVDLAAEKAAKAKAEADARAQLDSAAGSLV